MAYSNKDSNNLTFQLSYYNYAYCLLNAFQKSTKNSNNSISLHPWLASESSRPLHIHPYRYSNLEIEYEHIYRYRGSLVG